MRVRPFEESDREKVLDLCDEFWTKNFGYAYPFDRDHTNDKLDIFLFKGACIVLDDVSGLILLAVDTLPCNPTPVACDVMWYVKEGSRGDSGMQLLNAAINFCQLNKIESLSMAYMESSTPKRIKKIYEENGFVLKETTYHKVIPCQE